MAESPSGSPIYKHRIRTFNVTTVRHKKLQNPSRDMVIYKKKQQQKMRREEKLC